IFLAPAPAFPGDDVGVTGHLALYGWLRSRIGQEPGALRFDSLARFHLAMKSWGVMERFHTHERNEKGLQPPAVTPSTIHCRRQDLNLPCLYGNQALNLARLPIPPLRRGGMYPYLRERRTEKASLFRTGQPARKSAGRATTASVRRLESP